MAAATGTTTLAPSQGTQTNLDDSRAFQNGTYSDLTQLAISDSQAEAAGEVTDQAVLDANCTYDATGESGCNSNTGTNALLHVAGISMSSLLGNTPGWDPYWRLFVTHDNTNNWETITLRDPDNNPGFDLRGGGGGGGARGQGGMYSWWWAPAGSSSNSRSVWFHFPHHG